MCSWARYDISVHRAVKFSLGRDRGGGKSLKDETGTVESAPEAGNQAESVGSSGN